MGSPSRVAALKSSSIKSEALLLHFFVLFGYVSYNSTALCFCLFGRHGWMMKCSLYIFMYDQIWDGLLFPDPRSPDKYLL